MSEETKEEKKDSPVEQLSNSIMVVGCMIFMALMFNSCTTSMRTPMRLDTFGIERQLVEINNTLKDLKKP